LLSDQSHTLKMSLRTKINHFIVIASLLVSVVITTGSLASAQQSDAKGSTGGITVSPALATITIGADTTSGTATVTVKNDFNATVNLSATVKSVDQDNGILVPSGELDSELQKLITLNVQDFTLQPNESKDVVITVKNTASLRPGGTYASLVVRQISGSDNTIGLQTAVGAGIFVTKEDGAVRELQAQNIAVNRFVLQPPSSISLTFKNTGNVHIVPRGQIVVVNANNETFYQKGVINQESFTLLPGKSLRFEIPLQKLKQTFLPSRQKVVIQYRYDGSEQITSISKTIVVVPFYIFIILAALIIVVGYGVKTKKIRLRIRRVKKQKKAALGLDTPGVPAKKRIIVQDKSDGEKIPIHRGK